MRIHVDQIQEEGLELAFEESFEQFPVLAQLKAEGECDFPKPLQIVLALRRLDSLYEMQGEFTTIVKLACCRCLNDFEMPLSAVFTLIYSPIPVFTDSVGSNEVIELTDQDVELVMFDGNEIDTGSALQEQVVLALPYQPLCRQTCKGLCSTCGSDLNVKPCRCREKAVDPRLAILQRLKSP